MHAADRLLIGAVRCCARFASSGRTAVPGKNADGTMRKQPGGRNSTSPGPEAPPLQHPDQQRFAGDGGASLVSPEPKLTIHFPTSGSAAPFVRRSGVSLTAAANRTSRARRRNSKPTVAVSSL